MATINGTSLQDDINGTNENDVIDALAGDDVIHGLGGDDNINGNFNNDTIYGDDGNDSLNGFYGDDLIDGGAGDDIMWGGAGKDTFVAGPGNDIIYGNSPSQLFDLEGDIVQFSGKFADYSFSYDVANSQIVISGPDGIDRIENIETLSFADITLAAHFEISGTSQDDEIWGTGLPDLITGGAGNDVIDGRWGPDVIDGGPGDDRLSGAGKLSGDAGNDTITGFSDSMLFGGDGDDVLIGSSNVIGGDGVTAMFTGNFASYSFFSQTDEIVVKGPDGIDTLRNIARLTFADLTIATADLTPQSIPPILLTGTEGDDVLTAGADPTRIEGREGNDALTGGRYDDEIIGGAGNDNLSGMAGANLLDGGDGDDVINTSSLLDRVYGADGNDRIIGIPKFLDAGSGNDIVRYNYSTNHNYLPYNGDKIAGTALHGGEGIDTVDVSGTSDDGFFDESDSVSFIGSSVDGFEIFELSWHVIFSLRQLSGSATPSAIVRTAASASLGLPYQLDIDTLGETYADLSKLSFEEWIAGNSITLRSSSSVADLHFIGSTRNDTLLGGIGNDLLEGGPGDDRIDGQEGFDTASYASSPHGVSIRLGVVGAQDTGAGLDTFVSIENLEGSASDDILIGEFSRNVLSGGQGNDKLTGSGGDDELIGGAGEDTLDGGEGTDTASYATAAGNVSAYLTWEAGGTGEAAGDKFVSIENLIGSAYADILSGDGSNNRIEGGSGSDWLSGQGGQDRLIGGDGDDVLVGAAGTELMDGGAGIDLAYYRDATSGIGLDVEDNAHNYGDAAFDQLINVENYWGSRFDDMILGGSESGQVYGFEGNDRLDGRGGDDVIYGGAGEDILTGGSGTDEFFYLSWYDHVNVYGTPEPDEGGDTITDFQPGIDRITVSRYWFGFGNIPGPAAALTTNYADFLTDATSPASSKLTFMWDTATHQLWFDPDGNGVATAALVATLQNVSTLSLSDIWSA